MTLVQPGPFRTDFISRSLDKAVNVIADYEASSGKFGRFLASMDGRQPGDPRRAAEAIVELVCNGEAPLRFPLGGYVVKKLRDKAAALNRDFPPGLLQGAVDLPWPLK